MKNDTLRGLRPRPVPAPSVRLVASLCATGISLAATVAPAQAAVQVSEGLGLADTEDVQRITLDEALALGDLNPLLRRARAAALEADGNVLQSNAYPNPAIGLSYESLESAGINASESYLTLSQRFEWPGARSARHAAAAETAYAAWTRVVADSALLASRVKRTYVEAASAERTAEVVIRVADVFRQAAERARSRHAEGDLSLYELRRIEVEQLRYETLLADAILELSSARRALALLVAPEASGVRLAPADAILGAPPQLDLDGLEQAALVRRREVAALEADARSAEARVEELRALRLPEVTVTGGFKSQSDDLGGVFLGLSVPLPAWNRASGSISAASARVEGNAALLASTRREVAADARGALDVYRSQLARAEILATSDAAATDFLEVARVAYEAEEMNLIELLDGAEALRETELAVIRVQSELWIAYYDLERAVGGFQDIADQTEDGP